MVTVLASIFLRPSYLQVSKIDGMNMEWEPVEQCQKQAGKQWYVVCSKIVQYVAYLCVFLSDGINVFYFNLHSVKYTSTKSDHALYVA